MALRQLGQRFHHDATRHLDPTAPDYWEYVNRIRWVAGKVRELGRDVRVLDVGGGSGDNLLSRAGIENVETLDAKVPSDVPADARNLPFAEGAYDIVTCIDTLEHIPAVDRGKVIRELVRVAARRVVIVAPQLTPENRDAERLVLSFRKEPLLQEHAAFGLVDFDAIQAELDGLGLTYQRVELDNLHTWVIAMLAGYCDISRAHQAAFAFENKSLSRRIGVSIDVRH